MNVHQLVNLAFAVVFAGVGAFAVHTARKVPEASGEMMLVAGAMFVACGLCVVSILGGMG